MKYSLYPVMILREIRLRVRACSTMSEIKSVHRKEGDVCHKMEEDSIPSINGWTQPPLVWRLNGIGGGVSIRQALVKKHWLLERLQPCKHVFRYNVYHRIVSLACWYANNPSRGAGISVCTKCHHLLAVELFHKKKQICQPHGGARGTYRDHQSQMIYHQGTMNVYSWLINNPSNSYWDILY